MSQITPAGRADLAPTGTPRAGINYGNFILATKNPVTGGSRGVAVDLLREVGRRLVQRASRLHHTAEVDREGVTVSAPSRANYELFLSRTLKHAKLVSAADTATAFDLLVTGKVDALAGLKQGLIGLADKLPGSRMLDGRFMAVQQSIGVPKGRDAGLHYLRGVVEDVKASGLVARAIEKTGARGVSVAPPAPAP